MTYFHEVEDYQTYKGSAADFHFDYNANSGGGQAFFGGTFYDGNGGDAQPVSLNGYSVSFAVRYAGADFVPVTVNLGADPLAVYRFVPRGSGSSQMKLQIDGGDGTKRIAPSLLLAAFLMLPPTCGVNMASSLDESPLTRENYWLRSMWLNCEVGDDGTAAFIPNDFVFSGGASKRRGVAPVEGQVSGEARFFKLDFAARIKDIISAAGHPEMFSAEVSECLRLFSDVYTNRRPFLYQECADATKEIMRRLAVERPSDYSGISDPLPVIAESVSGAPRFTAEPVNQPRNLIYFGAPGTGKSHDLNELAKKHFDAAHTRRVTFHPDYSYASFVGCYKPTMAEEEREAEQPDAGQAEVSEAEAAPQTAKRTRIAYQFIPGPLVASYAEAMTHPDENFVLVIEEINRANPAAVFGDVFQLLDRDDEGKSEYPVSVSDDLGAYLFKEFMHRSGVMYNRGDEVPGLYTVEEAMRWRVSSMALPPNLYLWATMNSADQGVFPMDTAFKRRWEFRYMGINDGEDAEPIRGKVVRLGEKHEPVLWKNLRHAINDLLVEKDVNEDKLLGPYFLRPSALDDDNTFAEVFKSKVLLYLFEDAAKMRRSKVFSDKAGKTYSEICRNFDTYGDAIFNFSAPVQRVAEDAGTAEEEPEV